MRRAVVGVVVTVALAAGVQAAAASGTVTPYCGIHWGSLPKEAGPLVPGPVTNARAGQHKCYDRLVIDLKGKAPGYAVEYVPRVTQDGSGDVVPLRGGAKLQISVRAPAYDIDTGHGTLPTGRPELVNVSGFRTFRQVAGAGSFEGYTAVGLGVRGRLPFRVFTLAGPGSGSRLVIDVAHRWE
ncbi:MAG: AMIN-like domain-containing (lipo)protein [Egibacteraceae bacterium]